MKYVLGCHLDGMDRRRFGLFTGDGGLMMMKPILQLEWRGGPPSWPKALIA